MRIIGGTAKKRKLLSRSDIVRPTSDRIKETLFNILGDIKEAYFLDLYAGTGNIGIEALSRGASHTFFVENSFDLCKIIKENLQITGFRQNGRVLKRKVTKNLFNTFLNKCLIFDVVFADPPYEEGIIKDLFRCIDFNIVAKDGLFVVQHSIRETPRFRARRTIKIGDTVLSFYDKINR